MLCPPVELHVFPHDRMGELVSKYIGAGDERIHQIFIAPRKMPFVVREEGLWWDADYGLRLIERSVHGVYTHCIIGFDCVCDVFRVNQIQAARVFGSDGVLCRGFRWERLLLDAVLVLAQETPGCREVRVLRAEHTPWYESAMIFGERTVDEFRADLKRRYNGTARALKFKKCPTFKDEWVQSVERPAD